MSWHLLKKKRSTLVVWLLVTLSNLGTLHTVVQIRLSEFPVPENVVLPQVMQRRTVDWRACVW